MGAVFGLLGRLFDSKEEDGHHHRQTNEPEGKGTNHPRSSDPIRPKSEPNLGRTAEGFSHVTPPFKPVPSGYPKPSPSVSNPSTATSSDPFPLGAKPPPTPVHPNRNVAKLPRPSDEPSSSRVQSPSRSKATRSPPRSKATSHTPGEEERSAKQYKPVLRAVSPVSRNQQKQTVYVQKDTSPIYNIPEDIEDLMKRDIVPGVLQKPLSPSTYRDYFAALLYAEDFYIEVTTMRDHSVFLFMLRKFVCDDKLYPEINSLKSPVPFDSVLLKTERAISKASHLANMLISELVTLQR